MRVKEEVQSMAMPTHIVAAGGIVEDLTGHILLVKTIHGGWVFPGGQVEVGENLMQALEREILEESGIEVTVSHLIGIYSNTGTYIWHDGITEIPTKLMLDFSCHPVGGTLTTSEETTASEWVAKDRVLDFITAPPIRARYQAYLNFNGRINYAAYVTKPAFQQQLTRTI